MPLSWNQIESHALTFIRGWADAANEDVEAKSFWIYFFEFFGITDKRVATFELNVKKLGGAFRQALDYFPDIAERDLSQIRRRGAV